MFRQMFRPMFSVMLTPKSLLQFAVCALTTALALSAAPTALAETTQNSTVKSTRTRTSKTTVTTTETTGDEISNGAPVDSPVTTTSTTLVQESEINTVFGSKATTGLSGCKTEPLSQAAVRDLKADCKAWIKDQKSDLQGKFLTSSCEESCTDCGMSLQRCTVNGTVRYRP